MSETEEQIKQTLLSKAQGVEKLADIVVRAAEGRRALPKPLDETLKQIAELTSLCEDAVADHIEGALGEDGMSALATALTALHSGIDSLIVFHALEGSAYSTQTVAND